MWVSQTYLSIVDPDSDLFVYYLFEDYDDQQKQFTRRLEHELGRMGAAFGDKVSLFLPNPAYADQVENEVRNQGVIWDSLHGRLPGLLIARKPFAALTAYDDDCIFLPFAGQGPEEVAQTFSELRRLVNETLNENRRRNETPTDSPFGRRLIESIEAKPGFFGFRLDLKKLFRR
jgi:hypothetical protein